ncbi:MAG: DUF3147 family protein, partial [Bdellovibrionales bacterium]|nr:DUF3147 family protein [Bdellovibrionales bacterium]
KVILSALIIVAVSEISKRSTIAGSILASLPLISVLSMIWIYIDTKDTQRIATFSKEVCWFVLPSLVLFLILPVLLNLKINFFISLLISCAATAIAYLVTVRFIS